MKKQMKYFKAIALFSLAMFFALPFSTAQAWESTTVMFKNRYRKGNYITLEGDKTVGKMINNYALNSVYWEIEFVDQQHFRIKKAGTNLYLNMEKGPLACSSVPAGYWTSHWKRTPVGGGFYRIENRYRKGQVLNMEKGPLVSSNVPAGYWTSHWAIEPVVLPDAIKVDKEDFVTRHVNKLGLSQTAATFSFKNEAKESWWKGVKVFDRQGNVICLLETEGNSRGPVYSRNFDRSAFSGRVKVEVWKAKTLGVHTKMATIYLSYDDIIGKETVFSFE